MFTLLDKYIGRNILGSIFITLFLFIVMSGIFKYLDQLRKLQNDYDALNAAFYVLLNIPKDIEIFFPMAALLGALIGLGLLASHNELVVMEAAGVSRLRISFSVMKTAIPLVLLVMVIGEWVSPQGEQAARNMRAQRSFGSSLTATPQGFWAKDGHDFVYINKVNRDYSIENINIYQFNEQNRLDKIIFAKYAQYNKTENRWLLSQIEEVHFQNEQQIQSEKGLTKPWYTNITPNKLGVVSMKPEALSGRELYTYINYLNATGQEYSRYELLFWQKLLQPISVAVMMLMALSFIFGPLRSVSLGMKIITGIAFGFIFYLLDNVLGLFSVTFRFPPILGAILPSIFFLILSMYLLKRR